MMQRASALHTVQGGLSTFAINLQLMTDQFSEVARPRQIMRSGLLRGRLAGRYGTGAGRSSMGSCAESVEALMGAFAESHDEEGFVQETAADVEWINKWWPTMAAAMREEESLANRNKCTAQTQMDSEAPGERNDGRDPGDQESEVLQAVADWNKSQQQAEAREQYEALKEDEAMADEYAWQAKEDREIAEAREIANLEVSAGSTQRVTPEEQQRWDDWE